MPTVRIMLDEAETIKGELKMAYLLFYNVGRCRSPLARVVCLVARQNFVGCRVVGQFGMGFGWLATLWHTLWCLYSGTPVYANIRCVVGTHRSRWHDTVFVCL